MICVENYKLLVYSNKAHHLAFAGSVSIDSCLLVNIVYIAVYQSQNWRTLALMLSLTPIANGMPDWCRGHLATWHEDCGVSSSATQHTTAHHTRNKFQHIKRKYFNKWLSFVPSRQVEIKPFLKLVRNVYWLVWSWRIYFIVDKYSNRL